MTSVSMIASALEVALVIAAAVVFLALIAAAVAAVVWSVAGVISTTHESPAPHH